MKRTFLIGPIPTSLLILILNGCVPANQTIAVLDQQSDDASRKLEDESCKTRHLLQDRRQLEAQLAGMKTKRKSLETSDPVGNRSEIASLNREIAELEHRLKTML
jgi:chromosome segregation ATPase